ncbi:MAG: glycosyltransferase family 2 protein [Deltaproteobacteria bacterium]
MNDNKLKISVITAVFNAHATISDAIESVAEQTYKNVEHIVVDGASTDGTIETIETYRKRISVFISEPDNGIYDALNKGIAIASGDVIGFLHADDVYFDNEVLEKIATAFNDEMVDAVYGDLIYVRRDDLGATVRYWKSQKFSPTLLKKGWMPPHPTLYVRKKHYKRIGGFNTDYRVAADYFSILQLFLQKGFNAVYLPVVFVKMRWGGTSNKTLKNMLRKSYEDLLALRKTGVGGFGTLFWKNISKVGQFFSK